MVSTFLFDILLTPACLIISAVVLVLSIFILMIRTRSGQLTSTGKTVLIALIALSALYLIMICALTFLFNSAPMQEPVPAPMQ